MDPGPWGKVPPRRPHRVPCRPPQRPRSRSSAPPPMQQVRGRPGHRSHPPQPRAPTHAFGVPRPATAHTRTPLPLGPAVSSPSARPNRVQRSRGGPRRARGASPAPLPPRLPASGRRWWPRPTRAQRSPPGWGATPARSPAADPEAAPRPPAPGPGRSEGPCPAARGSAPWTPLGHVTRQPGCKPEDTLRRGQSARGAPGTGGGARVTREPGAGRRRGQGAPDSESPPSSPNLTSVALACRSQG